MKTKSNHIIKTSNLSIGYAHNKKSNIIASNLNIELQPGNLVCLLGKNGIGKSTLLRTLTKVQPALEGTVYLNNIPLNKLNNYEFHYFLI